jgi:hypothetical protein
VAACESRGAGGWCWQMAGAAAAAVGRAGEPAKGVEQGSAERRCHAIPSAAREGSCRESARAGRVTEPPPCPHAVPYVIVRRLKVVHQLDQGQLRLPAEKVKL